MPQHLPNEPAERPVRRLIPGNRHPGAMLMVWIAMLVLMQSLLARTEVGTVPWLLTGALPLVAALAVQRLRVLAFIVRARWLLVGIIALGLWATPGESLKVIPGATLEGVRFGLAQCATLMVALAWLALLLGAFSRDQLVAALCWLLRPLRVLGLQDERVAVRIALTLRAAEQMQSRGEADINGRSLAYEAPASDWLDRTIALAALTAMIGIVVTA